MDEITQMMDAMIERGKSFYQGLQDSDIPALKKVARKDRLPVPPSQLLPGLVAAKLITPVPLKAFSRSQTSKNGQESYCEYHMGRAFN